MPKHNNNGIQIYNNLHLIQPNSNETIPTHKEKHSPNGIIQIRRKEHTTRRPVKQFRTSIILPKHYVEESARWILKIQLEYINHNNQIKENKCKIIEC